MSKSNNNTMEDWLLGGNDLDDDEDDEEVALESAVLTIAAEPAATAVIPGINSSTKGTHPPAAAAAAAAIATATAASTHSSSTTVVPNPNNWKPTATPSRPSAITQALHSRPAVLSPAAAPGHVEPPSAIFLNNDDFEPMPYVPLTTNTTVMNANANANANASTTTVMTAPTPSIPTVLTKPISVTGTTTMPSVHQPMAPPAMAIFKPAIRRNALQLTTATNTTTAAAATTTTTAVVPPTTTAAVTNNTTTGTVHATIIDERTPPIIDAVDSAQEQKQKKERFILFTKVLMKYLETKDPAMHAQAKQVIRECAERNRAGDPAYTSVSHSMQNRLKALLAGTAYWTKAENYLTQYLSKGVITTTNSSSSSSTTTSALLETNSNSTIMPPPHPILPKSNHYSNTTIGGPLTTTATTTTATNTTSSSSSSTNHMNRNMATTSSSTTSTSQYSLITNQKPISSSTSSGIMIHPKPTDTAAAAAEARKKEEMNAKRKLQRQEAAARKKAKNDAINSSTTNTISQPSLLGHSFPISTSNSLTYGVFHKTSNPYGTIDDSSIHGKAKLLNNNASTTTSSSSSSSSSTPFYSSATNNTTTVMTNIIPSNKTSSEMIEESSTGNIVTTSPVTMGKKKRDFISKKVEDIQEWMEMIDHATPIQVSSLALLLGQEDHDLHDNHVHLLDEQRKLLNSFGLTHVGGDEPHPSTVVSGWSQRNIVSSRMAWARLRLLEQEQVLSTTAITDSYTSPPFDTIIPRTREDTTLLDPQEMEYSNTPVTEWYNEDRAEEDAALALLSEATQIFVKSILENSIQATIIRNNVDGIRLWHIQQLAASVVSPSLDDESLSEDVEPLKPCIPPLYIRLGCDVYRQRALTDGNAAKICQRMEEALARRDHVYYTSMENGNDSSLIQQRQKQQQRLWVKDMNDLSDPMILALSTSMGDLACKPSCVNMSKMASQDAKHFFDIYGGKDSIYQAPLGRLSKPTNVTRDDLMGPWSSCEEPFLSKYRRRQRGLSSLALW